MAKDLYEILGIDKDNFSEKELKAKYKKLVLKYHPDRQAGKTDEEKKEAEEKFKEIAHAYEVLSNPEKKKNYDMFGDENGESEMSGGFNPFEGFTPFGGFGDFNPFGGFGNSRSSRIAPGDTIQMSIPVTIEDLFNGLKKTVKYDIKVRCVSCHGKGGSGEKTCSMCKGKGRITHKRSNGAWISIEERVCPKCNGAGIQVDYKCNNCSGSGFETKTVTLDIEFPPGIPNNVYIQYEEKGSESKDNRGRNGDFIAISKYDIDEEKYSVEGLNVIEHINIPYYDVLLGCNYTVNIPNGVTKNIKISPCTKENKLIRLSKQGIKDNKGNTGDYYVCVHYDIPDALSPNEQKYLEMIRDNKS